MTICPAPQASEQHVFIVRWDDEQRWGHLAVYAGRGKKPRFMGWVNLDCNPRFASLAQKYALLVGTTGLREVWFRSPAATESTTEQARATR